MIYNSPIHRLKTYGEQAVELCKESEKSGSSMYMCMDEEQKTIKEIAVD